MGTLKFRLAWLGVVSLWLAVRVIFWNGYYTEDAPGYVTDAIWAALGNYHARDHVNGLNVGTYLPVAIPLRLLGKSELALAVWPLACSLLGLLSVAGAAQILFGRTAALLAGFLYATYPGDVFFSTVVMPDALQAGWVSFSILLIVVAYGRADSRRLTLLVAAGVAMGVCHLIRANDALLLPVGVLATLVCSRLWRGRGWRTNATEAVAYVAGWALVAAAEAAAYFAAVGDFFHRYRVVGRHYGTIDSIARAGLNTDPATIPYSLFAPVEWWLRGGWGQFNQDQAYHGLLFCWALIFALLGVLTLAASRQATERRARAGFGIAVVWLFWPLLYHQFGSQSLTHLVPMHRLSRHLVVYAPAAMFAIVAGGFLVARVVRATGRPFVTRLAIAFAIAGLLVHSGFNIKSERIAFDAFHQIKDTYVRIRQHIPPGTRTIVADPGDLCFLDFWMNPLEGERVKMIPFAAYDSCDLLREGVVLTQSNPGWLGQAPIIRQTVDRLPCLTDPPMTWELLYSGYPEKVFRITEKRGHARN